MNSNCSRLVELGAVAEDAVSIFSHVEEGLAQQEPRWRLESRQETALQYRVPLGLFSWGERVSIRKEGGGVRIESTSRFPFNVRRVRRLLREVRARRSE